MRFIFFLFVFLCYAEVPLFANDEIIRKLRSKDSGERLTAIEAVRRIEPSHRDAAFYALVQLYHDLFELHPGHALAPGTSARNMFVKEQDEIVFSLGILGKGRWELARELVRRYKEIKGLNRSIADLHERNDIADILAAIYEADPELIEQHQKDRSLISLSLAAKLGAEVAARIRKSQPKVAKKMARESLGLVLKLMKFGMRLPALSWEDLSLTVVRSDFSSDFDSQGKFARKLLDAAEQVVERFPTELKIFKGWNALTYDKLRSIAGILADVSQPLGEFRKVNTLFQKIIQMVRIHVTDKTKAEVYEEDLQEVLASATPFDEEAEAERKVDRDFEMLMKEPPIPEFLMETFAGTLARNLLKLDGVSMRYQLKRTAIELPKEASILVFKNLKEINADGTSEEILAIPVCRTIWESLP